MWLIWIIVAVVCCLIASTITDNKGRGGASGCLLGAILGPLGVVIAILLSTIAPSEQHQITSGTMKACPFCAEPIRAEATVCRYCGRDVSVVAPDPDALVVMRIQRDFAGKDTSYRSWYRAQLLKQGHAPAMVDAAIAAAQDTKPLTRTDTLLQDYDPKRYK